MTTERLVCVVCCRMQIVNLTSWCKAGSTPIGQMMCMQSENSMVMLEWGMGGGGASYVMNRTQNGGIVEAAVINRFGRLQERAIEPQLLT